MFHTAKIPKEFSVSRLLVVQALKITFAHASYIFKAFMSTVNKVLREEHVLCQLSSTLSAHQNFRDKGLLFYLLQAELFCIILSVLCFICHSEHTFPLFQGHHGVVTSNLKYKNCGKSWTTSSCHRLSVHPFLHTRNSGMIPLS